LGDSHILNSSLLTIVYVGIHIYLFLFDYKNDMVLKASKPIPTFHKVIVNSYVVILVKKVTSFVSGDLDMDLHMPGVGNLIFSLIQSILLIIAGF